MKKIMHPLRIVLILVFVFYVYPVFSQTNDESYLLKNLDTSLMDSYLDTADRQQVEQRWLDYARFGMSAVTSSWEKEVLLLMGVEFDITELKLEAEERLSEIIDQRFARWLNNQFFDKENSSTLGELKIEIEELNNELLYETQADGSIKYKNTENYEADKALWIEGAKAKIDEMLASWSSRMTTAYAALRSAFSDTLLLEKIDTEYNKSFETYKASYNSRLYRLYQIEQSRFSRLRLYDQYSLQHESEAETASRITETLISSTEGELNSKLDVLTAGLSSEVEDVEINGGIIDADNWEASFSALLEEGLNSWDEAEQQFLMERVEWEQRAGREAANGEEVWVDAYHQLHQRRTEWMTEFRQTLQRGAQLWDEENQALEEAIERAVDEINENIENSDNSLQSRIDNLVGMMLQSVNMMRAARNSWEYWMDRFDGGERNSFNTGETGFDADAMLTASNAVRPELTGESRENDAAWKEAMYWIEMFRNYQGYASDSQQKLAETYGIIVFDNPSLHTAFDEDALSSALLDNSVLEDDDAWEAVYLDEYQVELLKARAYMRYWEKQQEIAQAVMDYASDNSSTKEDAETTRRRLADAKSSYDEALAEYTELLSNLETISVGLEERINAIENLQTEIAGYQHELSSARDEY